MITINNYEEQTKGINFSKQPEVLAKGNEFLKKAKPLFKQGQKVFISNASGSINKGTMESYGQGALQIKNTITNPDGSYTYTFGAWVTIDEVDLTTKNTRPKPKKYGKKKVKMSTKKTPAKPKVSKPKKEKTVKVDSAKKVGHYTAELSLIKRFYGFLGREKPLSAILSFIKALQKAIKEGRVTDHKPLITQIQTKAVLYHNAMKKNKLKSAKLELSKALTDQITALATSEKVRTSVNLIKRFISMQGVNPTIKKGEMLLKQIDNALKKKLVPDNDPHIKEVKEVQKVLTDYIDKKRADIALSETSLNGLMGIAGLSGKVKKKA